MDNKLDSSHVKLNKLNLLKQLKITFESLIFDRGKSTSFNHSNLHKFNGLSTIFSRNIQSILEDGLIINQSLFTIANNTVSCSVSSSPSSVSTSSSPSQSRKTTNTSNTSSVPSSTNSSLSSHNQILWNFIREGLNTDESSQGYKDFDLINEQIEKSDNFNNINQWISYSLRQHVLLNQLKLLLSNNDLLRKYYYPNAFVLDESYRNDFLIYIKSYEQNNLHLLNKLKPRNYFDIEDNQSVQFLPSSWDRQSEFSAINTKKPSVSNMFSNNSSQSDLSLASNNDPISLNNSLVELKINEFNANPKVQHHRRMHSFPNIQINLAKKNTMLAANTNNIIIQNHSLNQQTDSGISSSYDPMRKNVSFDLDDLPVIQLNDHKSSIDDLINYKDYLNRNLISDDVFNKTSIYDFTHSVQINCECSTLDQENSHFILADLTINTIELIRTQEIDHLAEQQLFNETKMFNNKKQTNSIIINGKPISSSSNEASFDNSFLTNYHGSPNPNSSSLFHNSSDSQLTEIKRYNLDAIEDRDEGTDSNGNPLYNRLNSLGIQDANPLLSDDGFEVVLTNSPVAKTERARRFSWEKIDDSDTAEQKANYLIDKTINYYNLLFIQKQKTLQIPNLRSFELFIQMLEYNEYMQSYFENVIYNPQLQNSITNNHLSNHNSINSSLRIEPQHKSNNQSSLHTSISASSLYLSHQTNTDTLSRPNKSSQIFSNISKQVNSSIIRPFTKKTSSSTNLNYSLLSPTSVAFKVKSAAFAAAAAVSLSLMENLSLTDIEEPKPGCSSQPIDVDNNKRNNFIRQLSTNLLDTNDLNSRSNSLSVSPTNSLHQSLLVNNYRSLNARIIGDEVWAPVREQLILNLTPKQKRMEQMKQQHFRCADCGIQIRPDKIKTFYYCEYFCKYFCRCCHINSQSWIPAYIVNLLDFRSSYECSKKAKNFLEKIYNEPLITLESLNPNLFDKTSLFSKIKRLRFILYNSRSYINSCRFAAGIKQDLYKEFDDFIINDQHVYSIETLFKIKKGNYYGQLKLIAIRILEHIKTCEICSQQGYICGFCNKTDLLYPFEYEKVEKCPNCLACYHKSCFKKPEECPRCKRKKNRQQNSASSSLASPISTNDE